MTPSGDSGSSGIGTSSQVVNTFSGRQVSDEEVEESLIQDASSRKRKPSWLKELMKEAKESYGPPNREVRESRAP